MRNGYKITVYLDDNPYSPTYMETYEVREYDDATCPLGDENLKLLTDTCEIVLSGFTGYRIRIYQNTLTGEIINERFPDPTCEETDTDPVWVNIDEPYCEVDSRGVNTGYKIQHQKDINPNSPTYGTVREQKWKDPECSGGESSDCPRWEEQSRTCHVTVDNCVATFDGTADVTQMDVNPLSESYGKIRVINVEDSNCDNCTNTTFSWVEVGYVCGDEDPICSNGITEDDGTTPAS